MLEDAGEVAGPPPRTWVASVRTGTADPVVVFLALAGFFDGISGNPLHSVLLFGTAFALARDRLGRTDGAADAAVPAPGRDGLERRSFRLNPPVLLTAAAFAIVVGGFQRYTWPVTLAIVVPGLVALRTAWCQTARPVPTGDPLPRPAVAAWASIFVGLSLWELVNLFQQPDLVTMSYDHPTLSQLSETALSGRTGRTVALLVWPAFGWYLLDR